MLNSPLLPFADDNYEMATFRQMTIVNNERHVIRKWRMDVKWTQLNTHLTSQ